jgi:hypothetical protein
MISGVPEQRRLSNARLASDDQAGALILAGLASAHISRVKAGHLSLITRPADVTKVILSAVDAST